jgi:chromosomal replication initiator protein
VARRVILQRLAAVNAIPIPDDVIERLAEALIDTGSRPPSVPQLNDVLRKLHEFSLRQREPISAASAARFLGSQNALRKPQLRSITKQVCRYFNLKTTELRGPARQQRVVRARGVAMLLARQLTSHSLDQVGRHYGNRDHSTVLHACRKTQSLIQTDPAIRRAVEELTVQLSAV